ncbi:hypothetical protein EBESD8_48900 [Rhodococcus aetherivorans]|nr:hypothetical protein EBESD8_48900 [Rhodococcus aetherivorans]
MPRRGGVRGGGRGNHDGSLKWRIVLRLCGVYSSGRSGVSTRRTQEIPCAPMPPAAARP